MFILVSGQWKASLNFTLCSESGSLLSYWFQVIMWRRLKKVHIFFTSTTAGNWWHGSLEEKKKIGGMEIYLLVFVDLIASGIFF